LPTHDRVLRAASQGNADSQYVTKMRTDLDHPRITGFLHTLAKPYRLYAPKTSIMWRINLIRVLPCGLESAGQGGIQIPSLLAISQYSCGFTLEICLCYEFCTYRIAAVPRFACTKRLHSAS